MYVRVGSIIDHIEYYVQCATAIVISNVHVTSGETCCLEGRRGQEVVEKMGAESDGRTPNFREHGISRREEASPQWRVHICHRVGAPTFFGDSVYMASPFPAYYGITV